MRNATLTKMTFSKMKRKAAAAAKKAAFQVGSWPPEGSKWPSIIAWKKRKNYYVWIRLAFIDKLDCAT